MSDNSYVAGHILNNVVPTHGLDFMNQQTLTPNADGSINLLAERQLPGSSTDLTPNKTLKPMEVAALTYAFNRTMAQMRASATPNTGLSRHRGLNSRGAGWQTASGPMNLSKQTVQSLQQVNPRNPTANLTPLLRFFKGMENDGIQMNFVRKTDLSIIHQLQYRHGVSKAMPKPTLALERRRRIGPQRYMSLKTGATPKEVVAHTVRGNQIKDISQAAGLTRVLHSRPTASRNPQEHRLLRMVLNEFTPSEPKMVRNRKRKLGPEVKREAGFGPSSWTASTPTPSPK